jgi:DNA-binding Xre family transcriptional regulator
MDIYDMINQKLNDMGKTKKWLCDITGIPYNSIQTLFSRRSKKISFEIVAKISAALQWDLNEISKIYQINQNTDDNEHSDLKTVDIAQIIFETLNAENKTIAAKYMINLLKEQQKIQNK